MLLPEFAEKLIERLDVAPDLDAVVPDAFRKEYQSLVRAYRSGESGGRDMAIGAIAVGDLAAALDAIKRTIERREPIVTEYSLPCDPLLDSLKTMPEFGRMLTRAGMRVCPAVSSR